MDNTTYEFFIRRACLCNRFEKGADADKWDSLLAKEYFYEQSHGRPNEAKCQQEYNQKFAEIKHFIDDGYNSILYRITFHRNDELLNQVLDLKNEATIAETPQILFNVMRLSIDLLNANNL